jgi:hypothetical protein
VPMWVAMPRIPLYADVASAIYLATAKLANLPESND